MVIEISFALKVSQFVNCQAKSPGKLYMPNFGQREDVVKSEVPEESVRRSEPVNYYFFYDVT